MTINQESTYKRVYTVFLCLFKIYRIFLTFPAAYLTKNKYIKHLQCPSRFSFVTKPFLCEVLLGHWSAALDGIFPNPSNPVNEKNGEQYCFFFFFTTFQNKADIKKEMETISKDIASR